MTRTDPVPSKVGFVGVGHLGSLLAHSLLRSGFEVAVTDLRSAARLPVARARSQGRGARGPMLV